MGSTLFQVKITGRTEKVLVKNPDARAVARGGPAQVWVEDTTPMTVTYLNYRDCLLNHRRLARTAKKNPDARIEFPPGCGMAAMRLSDWLARAPTLEVPSEAAMHPERQGLPLGDPHPSFANNPFAEDAEAPAASAEAGEG